MADRTAIEWTDATWNPVRGCSRISPGCGGPNHDGGCYAEKIAARFSDPGQAFHGYAKRTPHGGAWTGKMGLIEDAVTLPLRWRRPRRIFVNSMSDLFHENLPESAIAQVFNVMAEAPHHTFQVLTKRSGKMRSLLDGPKNHNLWSEKLWHRSALPNVLIGVSVEDQERADERREDLRTVASRGWRTFVSYEPALGAVNWMGWEFLHWLISGGESGPNARPSHPGWHRLARDFCRLYGIAYFFKQWGAWEPYQPAAGGDLGGDVRAGRVRIVHPTGQSDVEISNATGGRSTIPGSRYMAHVGKKAERALLDGHEHKAFPA